MAAHEAASPSGQALTYPAAVARLLAEFHWNSWFLNSYWPENEPRVRLMADRAAAHFPDAAGRRAFEVGCANGYVAYLFRLLGYAVDAADAYDDDKRADLFHRAGIAYQETNLNDAAPLAAFPSASFDLVLLGEVFEHILNQPAGLLAGIHRVLRPGGLIILTTPNPSTLANAVRVLRDGYVLWGTTPFLRETKLDGGKVIDRGDIHYREYPAWVVRDLLTELGYRVGGVRYVRTGSSAAQSAGKRLLKQLFRFSGLSGTRLFAAGYVIWATKPA